MVSFSFYLFVQQTQLGFHCHVVAETLRSGSRTLLLVLILLLLIAERHRYHRQQRQQLQSLLDEKIKNLKKPGKFV